jgi:hypothetical protein
MVIEGGDGETITFGTGEIPEDMTTPIADGGDVTSTFTADGQMTVMVQYPQSMFDQLVATYDGHFTGDGVNRYESSSNTDDGNVRTVTWVSDDGNASVTVSDCYSIDSDGLDAVCVAVFEGGES